jgi:hypothetical protein
LIGKPEHLEAQALAWSDGAHVEFAHGHLDPEGVEGRDEQNTSPA